MPKPPYIPGPGPRAGVPPKAADPTLPKQAALVYHAGFAYVYQVEHIARLVKNRGRIRLLLKATFTECWRFAEGLTVAGWTVNTYVYNEDTSDVTPLNWSTKYADNLWHWALADRIINFPPKEK